MDLIYVLGYVAALTLAAKYYIPELLTIWGDAVRQYREVQQRLALQRRLQRLAQHDADEPGRTVMTSPPEINWDAVAQDR